MKHLGDITLIKGNEAPVVDCIVGGSPCQDLSLAGKRAGLAGARSGLYMEQIRIIKEMRENDISNGRTGVDIRPRYMVWENVPGAFSTNQGQDFAAVLEEAIRVAEPEAPSVPVPEKGWPTAGCIVGECWSIAWRVLDAQFWGTSDKPLPQRRRRIALVADFGGLSAPEILFVRKSVSGNIEPGEPKGKETAGDSGDGSVGAVKSVVFPPVAYNGANITSPINKTNPQPGDLCHTITDDSRKYIVQPVMSLQGSMIGRAARECSHIYDGVSGTLRAKAGDNQMAVAYTYDARGNGDGNVSCTITGDHQNRVTDYSALVMEPILLESNQNHATVQTNGISTTLPASMGMGGGYVPMVVESKGFEMQAFGQYKDSGCASSLKARDYKDATDLVVAESLTPWDNQSKRVYGSSGVFPSLYAGENSGQNQQSIYVKHIVRRLTPLECERLQGFPDGWTDIGEWVDSKGKKHKEADSPRYKALGNSIALPPWKWVLKRLCACYERDATMASLFDGIGGFPYIWEQLNGKGSCLWASEIEEFPIAVTKLRFGGN